VLEDVLVGVVAAEGVVVGSAVRLDVPEVVWVLLGVPVPVFVSD
jgi:hypothetical protein